MYRAILLIILIISYMRYISAPNTPLLSYMVVDLLLAGILTFIYFRKNHMQRQIVIKHSTVFIISYLIVYYQFPLDYILGGEDAIHYLDKPYLSEFCKGLNIANIMFAAFSLGHSFFKGNTDRISTNQFVRSPRYVNIICIISLIIFIITVNKTFLLRGYGLYDKGEIATGFEKIMQMGLITSFVLSSTLYKNDTTISGIKSFYSKFKIPILVLLIYSLLISLSGSRYVVLRMLSILFISYVYVVKPRIKIVSILFVMVGLAFLTTLQGLTRNRDGTTFESATKTLKESSSISPVTSELAFSVTTLHIATANVPEKIDYNYGVTFFPEFLIIIPGAKSLFMKIFNIPLELQSSSKFITLLGYGSYERGGLGSSSIADIYIAFGVIGCLVVFFIFGWLLRFIEEKTYKSKSISLYVLGISFCFYSQLMYLNRESLFTSIVGLPYIFLFIYISPRLSKN